MLVWRVLALMVLLSLAAAQYNCPQMDTEFSFLASESACCCCYFFTNDAGVALGCTNPATYVECVAGGLGIVQCFENTNDCPDPCTCLFSAPLGCGGQFSAVGECQSLGSEGLEQCQVSITPSVTASASTTPTRTPSNSRTATSTPTPSSTRTPSASGTRSPGASSSASPSANPTPSPTQTRTPSPTSLCAGVICEDDTDPEDCKEIRCDPTDGQCKLLNRPNGQLCNTILGVCIGNYACQNGNCVRAGATVATCQINFLLGYGIPPPDNISCAYPICAPLAPDADEFGCSLGYQGLTDELNNETTVCRNSTNQCEQDAVCESDSFACPVNPPRPIGYPCQFNASTAGVCDGNFGCVLTAPTPSTTPSASSSRTPNPTPSGSTTATPTATALPTSSPSGTRSPSASATPTASNTAAPSNTRTPSNTPSATRTQSPSESGTATGTRTPSATPSRSGTATPSPSVGACEITHASSQGYWTRHSPNKNKKTDPVWLLPGVADTVIVNRTLEQWLDLQPVDDCPAQYLITLKQYIAVYLSLQRGNCTEPQVQPALGYWADATAYFNDPNNYCIPPPDADDWNQAFDDYANGVTLASGGPDHCSEQNCNGTPCVCDTQNAGNFPGVGIALIVIVGVILLLIALLWLWITLYNRRVQAAFPARSGYGRMQE